MKKLLLSHTIYVEDIEEVTENTTINNDNEDTSKGNEEVTEEPKPEIKLKKKIKIDEFEAEKIVKTSDSVIGYNGDIEVFAFRGINDFSIFSLEDGQKFDKSEEEIVETEKSNLVKLVADLSMESKKKDMLIKQLGQTVVNMDIKLKKLEGGIADV